MSDHDRIPLAQAEALAQALVAQLAPVAERLEIAGSIRRRRPTVGDIEVLAVPRFHPLPDLFGDARAAFNELDGLIREWLATGVVEARLDKHARPRLGARYKALRFRGVAVDLFSALAPAQYGVLLAIRTGPGDFSKRLVTPRRQGGWCPDYYEVREGAIRRRDSGETVPTPEEADCFRALGLPYVPPEERDQEWV